MFSDFKYLIFFAGLTAGLFYGTAEIISYLGASFFAQIAHINTDTAKFVLYSEVGALITFTGIPLYFYSQMQISFLTILKWGAPLACVAFLLAFRPVLLYWGSHDWVFYDQEIGYPSNSLLASKFWVTVFCLLPALAYVPLYMTLEK